MRSFEAMHNDYLDPDLHGVFEEEPYCLHETCGGLCDEADDEYVCEDCGSRYVVDEEGYLQFSDKYDYDEDMYDLLQRELWRIDRHRPPIDAPTLDEFFDSLGQDGDFDWQDDGMCADAHVWSCGDGGCEDGWHTVYYATHIGRKNGRRWVEAVSHDQEGNREYDGGWDEREEGKGFDKGFRVVSRYTFQDFYRAYLDRHWDYFYDWARYWLDAYKTGRDPCDQLWGNGNVRKLALKSVASDMKYLYDIIARQG